VHAALSLFQLLEGKEENNSNLWDAQRPKTRSFVTAEDLFQKIGLGSLSFFLSVLPKKVEDNRTKSLTDDKGFNQVPRQLCLPAQRGKKSLRQKVIKVRTTTLADVISLRCIDIFASSDPVCRVWFWCLET
jgi:hypothetical protein